MFPNGSKIPQNSQVPSLTQQRDPNRSTLPAILPFANPCSKQSYTEGRLKAQPTPSEPFLHNYPSLPWKSEQTCKQHSPGWSGPSFQTAWRGLNVNVRVEGQSDHHLSLSVWRVTSPVPESTRCPFSCWQPVPGGTRAKMFSLVESLQRLPLKQPFPTSKNKMPLKKPFVWNVKTPELLHYLSLYYHSVFIIL